MKAKFTRQWEPHDSRRNKGKVLDIKRMRMMFADLQGSAQLREKGK